MLDPLLEFAQTACDRLFELKRYPEPVLQWAGDHSLNRPKIVAHRGAWNLLDQPENSMAAFLEAQRLGAWGIEFDVRFSKDRVAVVCHDSDLKRCFNRNEKLSDLNADLLPADLCRLESVLELENLHFMIEIKQPLSQPEVDVLHEKLKDLTPVQDFHLLALHPDIVRVTPQLPARAWVLVGELRTSHLIDEALRQNLGGVAGHYALLTDGKIERLHKASQSVGCGFITSKNLFNREWTRKVDWVFTNSLANLV